MFALKRTSLDSVLDCVAPCLEESLLSLAKLRLEGLLRETLRFQKIPKPPSTAPRCHSKSNIQMSQVTRSLEVYVGGGPLHFSNEKNLVHFSICACHPCAGAMLILCIVPILADDPRRESTQFPAEDVVAGDCSL